MRGLINPSRQLPGLWVCGSFFETQRLYDSVSEPLRAAGLSGGLGVTILRLDAVRLPLAGWCVAAVADSDCGGVPFARL